VGAGLAAEEVPGALTGLVDKSVLLAEEHGDARRYRLLDTIGHYGLDRLRDPDHADGGPDETALRRRHRDYYLELAERFHADWFGPRQVTWSRRMLAELPNLREALSFCLSDVVEVGAGVQLAGALYYLWYACGGTREGRYWLDRLLAADATPSPQRIAALTTNARLQLIQGAPAAAAETAAQAVELIQRYGHPQLMPDALRTVGLGRLYVGTPGAMELLEEAAVAAAELGENHPALAFALFALSVGALARDDPRRAMSLLADSRAVCVAHGDRWWQGITLSASITPAMRLGDLDRALEYGRESLRVRRGLRDVHGLASTVEFLGWVAATMGEYRRAARLLGAADRQWEAAGGSPFAAGMWLDEHDAHACAARQALGDRVYEAEFAHGRALTLDQAVAYAVAEEPPVPPAAAPGAVRLTRRQREIARLVAHGLSNREIASRLVISQRTAESHVQNILTALGVTSRAQIATWYATQGFPEEDSL
jgi:DNA-binding CsgD family transcriptional regulator